MRNITSSVQISNTTKNLFTDYTKEQYPDFLEFIKGYYSGQELPYANLDVQSNLLKYFNVENYRVGDLIDSTRCSISVNITDVNITVYSTNGFPDAGFVRIDDELIYYRSKTLTAFNNCVRGVTCSELINEHLVTNTSTPAAHSLASIVYNIATNYTNALLRKIKFELLPQLPDILSSNLPYNILLKSIKDFYTTKGTEDSIKFLFKIIYNDNIVKLKLYTQGVGANIGVSVENGVVVTATVISGGSNYVNTSNSYADVLVVGSGSGAKLKIDNIDNTGTITAVSIISGGTGYGNSTSTVIRELFFNIGSIVRVRNTDISGIIRYYDPDNSIIHLVNTNNRFNTNDVIVGDNNAIAKIKNIQYTAILPTVSYPYQNTLKPSESSYTNINKIVLRLDNYKSSDITDILNTTEVNITQDNILLLPPLISYANNINLTYQTNKYILLTLDIDDCNSFYLDRKSVV